VWRRRVRVSDHHTIIWRVLNVIEMAFTGGTTYCCTTVKCPSAIAIGATWQWSPRPISRTLPDAKNAAHDCCCLASSFDIRPDASASSVDPTSAERPGAYSNSHTDARQAVSTTAYSNGNTDARRATIGEPWKRWREAAIEYTLVSTSRSSALPSLHPMTKAQRSRV
jgi:hypothetical protein